jgi:hypothetical protein
MVVSPSLFCVSLWWYSLAAVTDPMLKNYWQTPHRITGYYIPLYTSLNNSPYWKPFQVIVGVFETCIACCVRHNCLFWAVLGIFSKLRKATMGLVKSVFPSVRNSVPNEWIFTKFDISVFVENLFGNSIQLKSDKNNGHFTWRPIYIFDHIWLIYSWNEMFQTKVLEKNLATYEIMWKDSVESDRSHMTIGACALHAG